MGLRYTAQCVVECKKKVFLKEIASNQHLKELTELLGDGNRRKEKAFQGRELKPGNSMVGSLTFPQGD